MASEDVRTQWAGYVHAGWARQGEVLLQFTEEGRREIWRQLGEILMEYPEVGELARILKLF